MKQTAVEFAFEELNKWRIENFGEDALIGIPQEVLDKAKEMEKEQMIEFAKYTEFIDTEKSDMNKVVDFYLTLDGEEFVEETFKSE